MARQTYKYEDLQPELERLLQDKESDELEFKTAAGGFPKSFWSTYSSFANNVTLPSSNVTLECYTSESNVTLPKRYTKEQLREKVMTICSDWVTAEQIAGQLGRNARYVKSHVLILMADVLEKMYDVPHHPRQKYRIRS